MAKELNPVLKTHSRPSENLPALLQDHLEKVHHFSVVARVGSFRKAAVILRRTQPSVSRSVQVLEDALHQPLFQRSRAGVRLTPAGITLFDFSKKLSAEITRVQHRLRTGPQQSLSAKLLVGSYESLAIRFFPRLVRELSKREPGVSITLKTDCEDKRMLQMVRTSELDIAFTIIPSNHRELVSRPIYEDDFQLYASRELAAQRLAALKKRGGYPLADLHAIPFVHVPTAIYGDGQSLDRLAWSKGILANQLIHELDSYEAAKEFILEGIGIGLLPRAIARTSVQAGRLQALRVRELDSEAIGSHPIHATFRRTDCENAAVQAVISEAERLL